MTKHAILQVVSGPEVFKKLTLAPGGRVRVGRGEGADLVLPDPSIGRVEFEIDWDGTYVEARTRPTTQGNVLLSGVPVSQAPVPHGAWIHAGATDFMVYYEGHTPPRVEPNGDPVRLASVTQALATLEELAEGRILYAVLDPARDERILVLLKEAIEEHRSLYEGIKGLALADVAPYLVRFEPGSRLLRALVEEGWGEAWGIYFTSPNGPKAVRRHLRRFLMVEEEESRDRLYLRFYDPRVLRDFLPLANARQKSEVFEEIDRFFCEGPRFELLSFDAATKKGAG